MSYVSLSPPLPCVAPGLGARGRPGVVTALSASSVRVLWADGEGPGPASAMHELVVRLGDRPSFVLPVEVSPGATSDATTEARVRGDDGRERLRDLLNLVRKGQHIAICESMDVEASDRYTGFSDLTLVPKALPELDWDELDTTRTFLGRKIRLPILITGMTGGLERGAEINRRLARAAARFGVPMGVGSQRVALENPAHAAIFAVKRAEPDVFLIGNLGMAQILGRDAPELCRRAVDMIEADALALHLNVLQELVQVEGDRRFRGLIDQVHAVTSRLSVPVIVKEVGSGIDPETARQLRDAGVAAVDCGGKGGTSWSYIEGIRAESPVTAAVANTFRDWGIPTAVAVAAIGRSVPGLDLVATGGIRDGLEIAKAMALGAKACGVGLPLFRAALVSDEAPMEILETLAQGLKTAMMATGAASLDGLASRLNVSAAFRERVIQFTAPTPF